MKVQYLRLAARMRDNGYTQKDLAEKLHMTKSALNRRMIGVVEWNVSDIKNLCSLFGATFEELFDD